ncbi:MAG: site-specific DNA-methyltransferase [Planctomycetes bacterium]|nr:site-specific DNA-methyltransferase [Planctomycetota bacterium]
MAAGNKPKHGIGQLDTVWEADWDGKARFSTFHPTSKPTRLFEIPMEQHTVAGDIVVEPFSGSGSQIIAAEKLGRRCYAMELQPAFVDGTIDRWQKATNKEARLEATGQTFAEVAAARKVAS